MKSIQGDPDTLASTPQRAVWRTWMMLLVRDSLAVAAAVYLLLLVLAVLAGPWLIGDLATKLDLLHRNLPPFGLGNGIAYVLGADPLGRSLLARLIVGAQNTLGIATAAVLCSMIIGGMLGLFAGYTSRWPSQVILRLADVIMSFPSLLLALVVLFMLGPSVVNVVLVLSITRIPVYLRTTRAEVLEVRERMFVSAAQVMGAGSFRIVFRHIAPVVAPTLLTIAAIDYATVILTESSLSFLGLGIQPPDFTWGAMVAAGRGYLGDAWWVSFWPGLAIMATTLSLNLLSSWARIAGDPQQRWRLELRRRKKR